MDSHVGGVSMIAKHNTQTTTATATAFVLLLLILAFSSLSSSALLPGVEGYPFTWINPNGTILYGVIGFGGGSDAASDMYRFSFPSSFLPGPLVVSSIVEGYKWMVG